MDGTRHQGERRGDQFRQLLIARPTDSRGGEMAPAYVPAVRLTRPTMRGSLIHVTQRGQRVPAALLGGGVLTSPVRSKMKWLSPFFVTSAFSSDLVLYLG